MIELLQKSLAPEAPEEQIKAEAEALDPRMLSSVLISLKLAQIEEENGTPKDPHARLLELMHSRPVRALLDSALLFGQREGMSAAESLQQIVMSFQEIDKLWNQVLLKEGLARLSQQYH